MRRAVLLFALLGCCAGESDDARLLRLDREARSAARIAEWWEYRRNALFLAQESDTTKRAEWLMATDSARLMRLRASRAERALNRALDP